MEAVREVRVIDSVYYMSQYWQQCRLCAVLNLVTCWTMFVMLNEAKPSTPRSDPWDRPRPQFWSWDPEAEILASGSRLRPKCCRRDWNKILILRLRLRPYPADQNTDSDQNFGLEGALQIKVRSPQSRSWQPAVLRNGKFSWERSATERPVFLLQSFASIIIIIISLLKIVQ